MKSYSLSNLADDTLLRDLATLVTQDRATTAELLAHIAEVDERKLYVPASYDSMYMYCVHELRMSEDTAYKRIRVARAARQFPDIFPMVADGRLNLNGVLLLTPHLTPESANDLLVAATHKGKSEIELLLAERFPQPDLPTLVQALAVPAASDELAARPVVPSGGPNVAVRREPLPSHTKLAPLSPERFALQVTVDKHTYDQLRYAQALLAHALPSGDVAQVIKRALDLLVQQLEKRKFAKTARPRPQRGAAKGRHIPAEVKRAVWVRDGGQCTFVSEQGKRCEALGPLELDHIDPVARGGHSTVDNLKLKCRAHNQYEAERVYGSEFMAGKREQAREQAAQAKADADAKADAVAKANAEAKAQAAAEAASQQEVIPWLRALGCNSQTARRAAERCAGMTGAPLEKRVFVAVQGLGLRGVRRGAPVHSGTA